jgi:arylsulfatase A-like enzyme
LEDRTLLVYLSATAGALDANSSDNYPLRGSKNFPWEGGWRVPFAMQWAGHLPKGMVYDQPVLSLDIFATITALANVPANPERPLDGVNLFPYLTGQKAGAPHDAIYLRLSERGGYAVRSGEYKLAVAAKGETAELFNLTSNLAESKNLAETKPELVRELEKKYADWSQQMMSIGTPGTTERNDPRPIDTDAGNLKTNSETSKGYKDEIQ